MNNNVRGTEWALQIFKCSQNWPFLDLLANFRQVLACSCSQKNLQLLACSILVENLLDISIARKFVNRFSLMFWYRNNALLHHAELIPLINDWLN